VLFLERPKNVMRSNAVDTGRPGCHLVQKPVRFPGFNLVGVRNSDSDYCAGLNASTCFNYRADGTVPKIKGARSYGTGGRMEPSMYSKRVNGSRAKRRTHIGTRLPGETVIGQKGGGKIHMSVDGLTRAEGGQLLRCQVISLELKCAACRIRAGLLAFEVGSC